MQEASRANRPPETGFRFSLITVEVRNDSGGPQPVLVTFGDFQLVGSSNQLFGPVGRHSCGTFPDALYSSLSQGSAVTGTICWKLPADEQNLIVIWESEPEAPDGEKRYLAVEQ